MTDINKAVVWLTLSCLSAVVAAVFIFTVTAVQLSNQMTTCIQAGMEWRGGDCVKPQEVKP